jgi:hypothetical protein
MRAMRILLVLTTAAAVCFPALDAAAGPDGECVTPVQRRMAACEMPEVAKIQTPRPMTVVAHIDTGVNPYNKNFRDRSTLAYKHPSTYIPGFPETAEALKLHLDIPYDKAVKADEAVWKSVKRGQLYWIPGTKIIGAISMGAGGTSCPLVKFPTVIATTDGTCSEHVILDDAGHGSMTASRSAGNLTSLAPDARLVTIEGLGARSVEWAADQGWIDVQTNSWLSLVPPPVPSAVTDAFARAASMMPTLAASGNGSAYVTGVAPTPTYLLSTAPPGVILVGGHDNGKSTLWSGAPPHVVADAYAGPTAIFNSSTDVRPDPISCCTSAASPYAAGGAAALILEARRILGDRTTGVRDGILAEGRCGAVETGPLADGDLTMEEFKDLFFHTAEPHPQEGEHDGLIHWAGEPRVPDHAEYGPGGNPFCIGCTTTPVPWSDIPDEVDAYQFIGYGGINEFSVALGKKVLAGKADALAREAADAQYEVDQTIRELEFGGATSGQIGGELEVRACAVVVAKN